MEKLIKLSVSAVLAVVALTPAAGSAPTDNLRASDELPTAVGPSHFDLAMRWAPVHYQDTDATDLEADFITSADYDGDWVMNNNWENLHADFRREGHPLLARVYYSVEETCTHFFISYAFFHPRDWTDKITEADSRHENDMEDAVAIVRKDGTPFGTLEALITQAHGNYLSWVPQESGLSAGSGQVIHGVLPFTEFPLGSGELHPETAQETQGHGLGAKGGSVGNDDDWNWRFAGRSDNDQVVYFPSGVAEEPESGDDRSVGYALESFFAEDGVWERQLAEDLVPGDTYHDWGTFRGDQDGGCDQVPDDPTGLTPDDCKSNSAGAPWGQDDEGDDSAGVREGEAVLHPAHFVDAYFDGIGFDDGSNLHRDYVENRYIADLKQAGYGPDGTLSGPSGYQGPDLGRLFDKLLGIDDDQDGLHSCDELSAYGTDPRSPDTDGDELSDGVEVEYGTDPNREDSDQDGFIDGEDVEWLQSAIAALPPSVFKNPSSSTRSAIVAILNDVEAAVAQGDRAEAIRKLNNLRRRLDGCGGAADTNDWVTSCDEQTRLRGLVDLLVTNLSTT